MKAKYLNGTTNGSCIATSGNISERESIFSANLRTIIAKEVDKARYEPEKDPFLQEHKRKVEKLLRSM